MKKLNQYLFIASTLLVANTSFANCTTSVGRPNTEKFEMRGNFPSYSLKTPLKKGQLVESMVILFTPDKSTTVKCTAGSQVQLKMQRGNVAATPYEGRGEAEVPHAYYVSKSARGDAKPDDPANDWIYTVQTAEGDFFDNDMWGGHRITVPESEDYRPRKLIVTFYAGKDNPTTPLTFGPAGQTSFMAHIQLNGDTPTDSEGIIYQATGTITPPPVINTCSIDDRSRNMSFVLAAASTDAFNKIGHVAGTATENLTLECSGGMIARMKLSNATFIQDTDAKMSVIKPAKDGQGTYATGIGFVLSSNGQRIESDDFVQIPQTLQKGIVDIPIKAQYYRFGSDVKAGSVEATADFTVTFN